MSEIIDFLVAPYQEAYWFDVLLEILAAGFGIASVWFAKQEKIWVYPTGIISTLIYIYICYKFVLYGDMIINVYYSIMSVYGWYMWTRIRDDVKLEITCDIVAVILALISIVEQSRKITYMIRIVPRNDH